MIARLSVLLPMPFYLHPDAPTKPLEVSVSETEVALLWPPAQSQYSKDGGAYSVAKLAPVFEPARSDRVKINDQDSVPADMIQVEFHREGFDRRVGESPERAQLVELGFAAINQFLIAFRVLSGAWQVKAASPQTTSWRLTYLANDGSELAMEVGLIRESASVRIVVPATLTLSAQAWAGIGDLGSNYTPYRWDELLVDASGILPEVGPAIVLAYTALEIRIAEAADSLAAQTKVHAQLWDWISKKRTYLAQPTTEELVKIVFGMLAGKSLSEEAELWQHFTMLRKARNSFAHEGVARDLTGVVVTPERAGQLVAGARQVLDWIDQLLPADQRRKELALPTVKLEVMSAPFRVS